MTEFLKFVATVLGTSAFVTLILSFIINQIRKSELKRQATADKSYHKGVVA